MFAGKAKPAKPYRSVLRQGRIRLFRDRNPSRSAGFHPGVCSPGHYVVPEAAIDIATFLLDDHFVAEKRHGDFAFRCVARDESRDLAFGHCFSDRLTNIWVAAARHPFTVELNLQFVMAQGENPNVVAVIFVDAVDLGGCDNMRFCRATLRACGL